MEPRKFRKKPVIITAVQWTGANYDECRKFVTVGSMGRTTSPDNAGLLISTLEGVMTASPGDWIICGVKGEFYPCKPDIFATTYEAA